mmetsp:Transcript_3038/g.9207  ORF Transcript_3038/g.9207 Transcript_3038/m.9207 type:complete len:219 (+) Transcript_3038:127-783(+)
MTRAASQAQVVGHEHLGGRCEETFLKPRRRTDRSHARGRQGAQLGSRGGGGGEARAAGGGRSGRARAEEPGQVRSAGLATRSAPGGHPARGRAQDGRRLRPTLRRAGGPGRRLRRRRVRGQQGSTGREGTVGRDHVRALRVLGLVLRHDDLQRPRGPHRHAARGAVRGRRQVALLLRHLARRAPGRQERRRSRGHRHLRRGTRRDAGEVARGLQAWRH